MASKYSTATLLLPLLLVVAALAIASADASADSSAATAGEAQRRAGYESFRLKRGYHFFRLRKSHQPACIGGGIGEVELAVLRRLTTMHQADLLSGEEQKILQEFAASVRA